jgi:hypothetical protein
MSGLPFSIGDKVLASRNETGDDHELATVVDSYELIIGEDRRPMVTLEFEDGERKYMKATPPNVLYVEPEEEEVAEGEDEDVAAEGGADEEEAEAVAEPEAEEQLEASISMNGDGTDAGPEPAEP